VFIPLVDLTRENGPTEFVPRSHVSWGAAEPSIVPCLKAGSYLVFDYRLRHRGLGNRSLAPRPLLYLTYAKPFFADLTNFSAKRYPPLPEVRAPQSAKRAWGRRAACHLPCPCRAPSAATLDRAAGALHSAHSDTRVPRVCPSAAR
jgi:ectoine hydroxylase-related dioxygenase (phytanoyl-CoA dioxygenase family)